MPLWRIYTHPSVFTPTQRRALAAAITKLYTSPPISLPAFYVNVLFIPLQENEIFVGGLPKKNFVRITIEQIARQMMDPVGEAGRRQREGWMERINETLKTFIIDRPELEWEHHISETPRDLWRVQGLDAPPSYSEGEAVWREENRASPWR